MLNAKMQSRMVTKESLEQLILIYREHKNLYDIEHPDYENGEKCNESLQAIKAKLKALIPRLKISVQQIEQKLCSLTNRFLQERNLVREAAKRGQVYIPKLWCYSKLEFLPKNAEQPFSLKRKDNDETSDRSKIFNIEFLDELSQIPPKSQLKHKVVTEALRFMKSHIKTIEEEKAEKKRSCTFGAFVDTEVQKIKDPLIRMNTKWDIQMAVKRAIDNDLD